MVEVDLIRQTLFSSFQSLLKIHRNIHFYIWVGTCDFTLKGKHFIQLKRPVSAVQRKFCDNLLEIKKRCSSSRIRVTFLHIPLYSIAIWNKEKGHQGHENFKTDDQDLTAIIKDTNSCIDQFNSEIGLQSPKFNNDLERSRKRKSGKQRYSYNFKLLCDGIHPGDKLAHSWLMSIKRQINRDCEN